MGAPRVSTALFWPRENQAFKTRPPARGACRAKEARPRQEELAGTTEPKHRDPGKWSLPGRPFQAQGYFTNTRPWQEGLTGKTRRLHHRRHASALHAPRRGPGSDKLQSPASSRDRQGQDPGKALAGESCAVGPRSSSSNHASRWGPFQGRVAGGCAPWGTRWHSTMVKPSPWQTETQGRALLGSTATGIECSCPPLSK